MMVSLWGWSRGPLGWADFGLLAVLLGAFGWSAWSAGPCGDSACGAFLDDRRWSWWKAALALLASEISALTIVALPAAAFAGGWIYAQFFMGALLGRAVCWWLIPILREGSTVTVYGWAGARLGKPTACAAAALFSVGRWLSSSLRLAVAAMALSLLSGPGPGWCILLLCVAAGAYVGRGGLRAVARASAVQCGVMLCAVAASGCYVFRHIPGGFHGAWRIAAEGGRLAFYEGAGSFAVACLYGLVGAFAGFAADHELVQKLLACRSDMEARRALAASTAASAVALVGLLGFGTCLYAFYRAHTALAVPERLDDIVTHFAATMLPAPLRGLLAAAVFMAAMNLPLSSLSAVTWSELGPGREPLGSRMRRGLAWSWAAALGAAALALLSRPMLERLAIDAWPVAAGPLLGLVLAAAARRRRGALPAAAAVVVSAGLAFAAHRGAFSLDAGWLIPVGAVVTLALAWF